jgi:ADP-ribose pyrophosphatase YjhB (NUDIX family)
MDPMLTEPSLQAEIIARVLAGNFGDAPDAPVHALGPLTLPDGTAVACFVRHAADAVITDAANNVVLITRRNEPGIGKLALPGGFMDEVDGVVETPRATAMREAVEETRINPALLRHPASLGPRRYARPFDIRAAWNHLPGTSIKPGDLFMVSTQGFSFTLPDLTTITLNAGDDAAAVRVLNIATLTPDQFAVPDHLPMIHQALELQNDRK